MQGINLNNYFDYTYVNYNIKLSSLKKYKKYKEVDFCTFKI